MARLGWATWVLLACGAGTNRREIETDAGSDAGDPLPTIEGICGERGNCLDAGGENVGVCEDVLGVLGQSTGKTCEDCLQCLDALQCDDWIDSPNGPSGCESVCRPCEISWDGDDDGEFWDECATHEDCAYAHFCLADVGRCQRVCDEGAQCNLTFCGEDRRCWLACGDSRCPDPGADCTEEMRDVRGNVFSVCAGGE